MEQNPSHREGEPTPEDTAQAPSREANTEERQIDEAIALARQEQRLIDHDTARRIAGLIHPGSGALYEFATSGTVLPEIGADLEVAREVLPELADTWIAALDEYCYAAIADPAPTQPTPQARDPEQSAERAPSGPSSEQPIEQGIASAEAEHRSIDDTTARLIAEKLSSGPDSALGMLAGCGAILEDEVYEELFTNLEAQTPEHQRHADALYSYCIRRDAKGPVSYWTWTQAERESLAHGGEPRPMIWVASLSDYNAGVLHGMWVDAGQEPDEIEAQINWILRTSPTARAEGTVAEEWGIFDALGFGGYQVDEYTSLDVVSLVAQGIARHGEAYAQWVEYIGDTSGLLLEEERFREHYIGHFDSMQAYVEHDLTETGFYQRLEEALQSLPEDLRNYVTVDTELLARDWEMSLHAAEASDGGVYIFDTHA